MKRPSILLATIAWACSLAAGQALAHGDGHPTGRAGVGPRNWGELWQTWGLEPGVLIPLAASAWLYGRGLARLWRAGAGRGVRRSEAACFAAGWLALAVALVSPLHPWGGVLFSAHMTQHEILMLVAAPLLVLGRPVVASLKALPGGWARVLGRGSKAPAWQRFWSTLTNPFVAWLVHAGVLWAWHLPAFFQATIDNEFIHAIQHLSFLLSALLFWWALLHGRDRRVGFGLAVAYLFTTALHSGVLGALIALARSVWYPAYAGTTASWGLTPLEDQQLGGLIMWIPACSIYVAAGLMLFAGWLRESARAAATKQGTNLRPAGAARPPRGPIGPLIALALLVLPGCVDNADREAVRLVGGDPDRGRAAVVRYGCGSCHTIPGISGADALVGPSLDRIGRRTYVAGVLTNTPEHLIRWIKNPPGVDPLTAMPNLRVGDADARDIATFLYTLQ